MAANDSLRTQALSLYRSALRMTRLLPYPQLRSKTRYNIRLLYSVYKDELDAFKIKEIIANGVYDVETFRMVCKVNNGDTAKELFKPFEPVSKERSDIERDGVVQDDSKHNLTATGKGLAEELASIVDAISEEDLQSVMTNSNKVDFDNK